MVLGTRSAAKFEQVPSTNCQSVLHLVLVPLDPPQHADAAKDALGKGPGHNLRDRVGESTHDEECAKDGPVELVEQTCIQKVKIIIRRPDLDPKKSGRKSALNMIVRKLALHSLNTVQN